MENHVKMLENLEKRFKLIIDNVESETRDSAHGLSQINKNSTTRNKQQNQQNCRSFQSSKAKGKVVDLLVENGMSDFSESRGAIWIEYNEMRIDEFAMKKFASVQNVFISLASILECADSIYRRRVKFSPLFGSKSAKQASEPDCNFPTRSMLLKNGKLLTIAQVDSSNGPSPPPLSFSTAKLSRAEPFGREFSNKRKHWNHIVLRNKSIICVFSIIFSNSPLLFLARSVHSVIRIDSIE